MKRKEFTTSKSSARSVRKLKRLGKEMGISCAETVMWRNSSLQREERLKNWKIWSSVFRKISLSSRKSKKQRFILQKKTNLQWWNISSRQKKNIYRRPRSWSKRIKPSMWAFPFTKRKKNSWCFCKNSWKRKRKRLIKLLSIYRKSEIIKKSLLKRRPNYKRGLKRLSRPMRKQSTKGLRVDTI